ncbi:histidinol-phosphate transaminase [Haloplanus halobius]|uniref:histidinol-phosphate transaminase n=1 Tax=Haloplanus halobius TaxID=2934938 RepID=UPI002010BF9B|nr:histidinol-phosphate transaminase [Haloplanus sp. XH21]
MQPRDLSHLSPYVPGRGAEEVARELGMDPADLTKLSSNENPHGPSPAAVDAIRETAPNVGVYPKASHTDLGDTLADQWGVTPEQVWVTPGADGALDYLSRAFLEPGDRILAPEPGFSYYRMSARYHHGEVATYHLDKADDFAQTPDTVLDAYDGERIVYLTTPHNPTGSEFAREDIETLADAVADHTLVVVDEAYAEYTDAPSTIDRLDAYDNLAVTRTFSKAYGLAGLRVGYAIVPESWADAYARVNTPFAASEVGCRAAIAALDDDDHLETTIETARWAREYLRENLDTPTWESGGNFVLAEVGDASAVAEATQRQGVIIRDCTSFGLPACVRVSCGTRESTREAVEVINDVLQEVTA